MIINKSSLKVILEMPTAKITGIKKALKLDASRLLRILVAGSGFEPKTLRLRAFINSRAQNKVMRIKNLRYLIILKTT